MRYPVEPSQEPSFQENFTGAIWIIGAEIFCAAKVVLEEEFVEKFNFPVWKGVCWEGFFGFLTLTAFCVASFLIRIFFLPGDFGNSPSHVYDGIYQLSQNSNLCWAFCGSSFSIGFFLIAGIFVSKEMSATTRMVLDSVRILVVWGVSLAVGWQQFKYKHLGGVGALFFGMFFYRVDVIAFIRTRYNRLV